MLAEPPVDPPRAALYFPNGYTRGEQTLLGDIVRQAGFANIAQEADVQTGAHMPLEHLVMAEPDVIITGSRHDGKSRSENILQHPVLDERRGGSPRMSSPPVIGSAGHRRRWLPSSVSVRCVGH